MEKIDTDYKRRTWKISAKLFKIRTPWRSSFKQNACILHALHWMLLLLFSGSQIDIHGNRENVSKDRQIPRDLQSVGPSGLVSQWILGESDLRSITAIWKGWEWEVGELKETVWSPVSASYCQPRVLITGAASVCWLPGISVTSGLFQNVICRVLSELNGCYK